MIRLIGCILTAGGAAYLGFCAAERLRRQLRELDELAAGLLLLGQELELSAPELAVLMERLKRRTHGTAKRLFSMYEQELSCLGSATAAQLWERAVSGLEDLTDEAKECLLPLGEVLGRYECHEQCEAVVTVRARILHLREREERDCKLRCRAYQTVGLSGGAFLVILLL